MSWTPPEHEGVRDKLAFDCDDQVRAGVVIASLLAEYPEVWVRRTRRGFHVVVDAPHDLLKRREIGDCYGRLYGDYKRRKIGLPLNIIFFYKNKRFVSKWVRVKPVEVDENGLSS